jgi:tRNA 2-thiocytidine biosynthesis protein TtcA
MPMREWTEAERIERDLIRHHKGTLYGKFIKAIDDYELIRPGDKIAVAMSGGKDSLLMAKLFQEAKRRGTVDFELVFLTMDPGFAPELLQSFLENCRRLEIPVVVEPSRLFDVLMVEAPEDPCFLCARMRRGFLYQAAKKHGCNKLALGHHFNDVIETTMLNVLYAGQFRTMMPKARSEHYENMELIRPLYLIKEDDIIRFMKANGIETIACGCNLTCKSSDSRRAAIKQWIKDWKKTHPDLDISIFRAAENVGLHNVLGYVMPDGTKRTFQDDYE